MVKEGEERESWWERSEGDLFEKETEGRRKG